MVARSGQVCAVDVLGATIAPIEAVNPTIDAFTKLTIDRARAEAAKVECWWPPATPCVRQPLWRENMSLDGQNLPVRPTMGWFTQSLTLIGLPTVVVPVLVAEQALPIGLPIIAAPWRETDALWAAQQPEGLEVTKFIPPRPI
jgi:Asp-tRNA(Asn)/Glu-tRNA(Gln) amidotransferase A subunit family amidase